MIILIVIPLIGSLQTSVSYSSTVHPRKDGSTSTVIPFEGQEERTRDPIDDTLNIGFVLALLKGGVICKPGKRLAKKNC